MTETKGFIEVGVEYLEKGMGMISTQEGDSELDRLFSKPCHFQFALARVYFELNETSKAVEIIKKAISAGEDIDDVKIEMIATVEAIWMTDDDKVLVWSIEELSKFRQSGNHSFPNVIESAESDLQSQIDISIADTKSNLSSLLLDDETPDLVRCEKLLTQALVIYEEASDNQKIGECLVSLGMVFELRTGDGSVQYERACDLFEGIEDLPEQFSEFLKEYRGV